LTPCFFLIEGFAEALAMPSRPFPHCPLTPAIRACAVDFL
jgi:hypothetical protein